METKRKGGHACVWPSTLPCLEWSGMSRSLVCARCRRERAGRVEGRAPIRSVGKKRKRSTPTAISLHPHPTTLTIHLFRLAAQSCGLTKSASRSERTTRPYIAAPNSAAWPAKDSAHRATVQAMREGGRVGVLTCARVGRGAKRSERALRDRFFPVVRKRRVFRFTSPLCACFRDQNAAASSTRRGQTMCRDATPAAHEAVRSTTARAPRDPRPRPPRHPPRHRRLARLPACSCRRG